MSASIARYLKDFGAPPPPPVLSEDLDFFGSDMADVAIPIEEPVDIEAEKADAHEAGRRQAGEELSQQFETERAALVDAHQAEIAALKAKYESDLAHKLATSLAAMAAETAREIADQTAAILAPLLDEAIAAKAVDDLAGLVRAAVLEGEVQAVTVRGPAAMFEELRALLGENAGVVRHIETADVDLTVELGEASLVTRLSAWSASLKKVLG